MMPGLQCRDCGNSLWITPMEGTLGCLQPHVLLRCHIPPSSLLSLATSVLRDLLAWEYFSWKSGANICSAQELPVWQMINPSSSLPLCFPGYGTSSSIFSIFQVILTWYQPLAVPADCPSLSWCPCSQDKKQLKELWQRHETTAAGATSLGGICSRTSTPKPPPRAHQRVNPPSPPPFQGNSGPAEPSCSMRGQCGMKAKSPWNLQSGKRPRNLDNDGFNPARGDCRHPEFAGDETLSPFLF